MIESLAVLFNSNLLRTCSLGLHGAGDLAGIARAFSVHQSNQDIKEFLNKFLHPEKESHSSSSSSSSSDGYNDSTSSSTKEVPKAGFGENPHLPADGLQKIDIVNTIAPISALSRLDSATQQAIRKKMDVTCMLWTCSVMSCFVSF